MIRHSLLRGEIWNKTAVIEDKKNISYSDILRSATAIGQHLVQKRRENIGIFLPNSANYISALFGVFAAGMTAFPLSVRLTVHEIASLLTQAQVHTVITSKAYSGLFNDIIKSNATQVILVDELQGIESDISSVAKNIGADEPMVMLTTSGTTGNAKIVQLSERNVASSTFAYIDKMDFEKFHKNKIRMILGAPFCSAYGLMILTACVIKSIPIIVLNEVFTLDMLYKVAAEHKATHFEGGVSVGLMMQQTVGRSIPYDISSLKYFGLAGSKLPSDTLKKLTKRYPGVEFWPGYGMSEAGPLIAKPDKRVNMDKPDSVGTKIDCAEIMVDIKGLLTDLPNTVGELVVKGPGVMLGYFNNEDETCKILKNGYLYTGDIGYFDEDGDIYICGRKKNVIIVRGFNVHAEEVEDCIQGSGLVKDCFVYGEIDTSGNETVCADIIPIDRQIQPDKIQSYCRKYLSDYKQPRKIKMVDVIRKTSTGKTERK